MLGAQEVAAILPQAGVRGWGGLPEQSHQLPVPRVNDFPTCPSVSQLENPRMPEDLQVRASQIFTRSQVTWSLTSQLLIQEAQESPEILHFQQIPGEATRLACPFHVE